MTASMGEEAKKVMKMMQFEKFSVFSVVDFDISIRFERRCSMERKNIITMHGNPLTLIGADIKVGDKAPDFTVIDGDLNEVKLGNYAGKIKMISVTPSLDTPVCDIQARRFNHEAAAFPVDVAVLNISMDLPFAISRFCTVAEIDKVKGLSDP